MVLAELARLLGRRRCVVKTVRTMPGACPQESCASAPPAAVYAIDACGPMQRDVTLVEGLLERFPEARVLVLADRFTAAEAIPFLRVGAKGLLPYAEVPELFSQAVAQVARGRLWVSRDLVSAFVESMLQPARPSAPRLGEGLSRREQEVMQALLENQSNKEIGTLLHISERTAKFHVANILKKAGVRRRSDLIAYWWQSGARAL